ncbi:MAG: hypothetical protein OHK0046_40090 [Anaerolineae bacterium]
MLGNNRRILVTGGGSFLGNNIAAALLAEGAEVTLLVRAGLEGALGPLAHRARWAVADVWDPASLRGRARGHAMVIHTVGSLIADPAQGLTYHRLNFVSARNVVTMCVSDGVPHMMLMSSVGAPWINPQYIRAKREAEQYLTRVGVKGTIIRAPIAYSRQQTRSPFFMLMTALGGVPPFAWLGLNRSAPMPVDVLARGVAKIALLPNRNRTVYYAPELRKYGRRSGDTPYTNFPPPGNAPPRDMHPFDLLDEDSPFGWAPPTDKR